MADDNKGTVKMIGPNGVYDVPYAEAGKAMKEGGLRLAPQEKPNTAQYDPGVTAGAYATAIEPLTQKDTYKGLAKAATNGPKAMKLMGPMAPLGNLIYNMGKGIKNNPGSLVDKQGISEDLEKGWYGSATGRGIGQIAQWLSMFAKGGSFASTVGRVAKEGELGTLATKGIKAADEAVIAKQGAQAISKVEKIGEHMQKVGAKTNKAAEAAASERLAEHKAVIDKSMAAVEEKIGKEIIDFKPSTNRVSPANTSPSAKKAAAAQNAFHNPPGGVTGATSITQTLQQQLFKSINRLDEIGRASGVPVKAVLDAQDLIRDIAGKLEKSGGVMSWSDARTMYKELGEAQGALRATSNRAASSLSSVREVLDAGLQDVAKSKGMGDAYTKALADYKQYYNLQRGYSQILAGKTESMMRASANPVTKGTSKVQRVVAAGQTAAGASMGGPAGGFVAAEGVQKMMDAGEKSVSAAKSAALKKELELADKAIEHYGKKLGIAKKTAAKGTPLKDALATTGAASTAARDAQNQQ